MSRSKEKKEILEDSNYQYHFRRMIYFNRDTKKIFSFEAIEDNDPSWLINAIKEVSDLNEWRFYFNGDPSDDIKKEIIKELGG